MCERYANVAVEKRKSTGHESERRKHEKAMLASSSSGRAAPSLPPKAGPSFPLPRPKDSTTTTPSSSVLQKLAKAHKQKNTSSEKEATIVRSAAFSARPPSPARDGAIARRDDDMTLIEDLPLGPVEHKPPFDDPHFEKLEPNSGIRLSYVVLTSLGLCRATDSISGRASYRTKTFRTIFEGGTTYHLPSYTPSSASFLTSKATTSRLPATGSPSQSSPSAAR